METTVATGSSSGGLRSTLPAIEELHVRRSSTNGSQAMMMRAASYGSINTLDGAWHAELATVHGDDDDEDEDPSGDEHTALASLKSKVQGNRADGYGPTGLMHPLHVRRRFHSSDVVLRTTPMRGGLDSPTMALRQWIAEGGSSRPGLSPAQIHRHRQRRRAQSTDLAEKMTRHGVQKERVMRRSFERPYHSTYSQNVIAEEILHDDGDNELTSGPEEDEADSSSEDEFDEDDDEDDSGNLLKTRSQRTSSDDSNRSLPSDSSMYSNNVSRSYESIHHEDPPSVEKLRNLQKLFQEGFITVTEYKDRRLQLVDELTLTNANKTINRTTDLIQTSFPVIHREPPDFTVLRERDAIKHVFDSEKRKWTSSRIKIKIDPQPFARGGLRQVFHLQDLSVIPRLAPEGRPVSYVAKIAIDVNEDPDTYFRDVEMQAVASKFAKLYNTYNPPRRVEFLDAWILQLIPGSNVEDEDNLTMTGTICGVEPYIAGEYHKHNNNFGYVSDLERNTPQAFSHFTYEASGQQMLVVDIQGVSDHYTDPQIHTRSGKEFGKGNLATRGFERFLASHRCNPICRYLKLPLINPKDETHDYGTQNGAKTGQGTIPAQTYMSQPSVSINRVDSELCHYYGDSKAFKKYQAKHQNQDSSDAASVAFAATLKDQRNCSSCCGVGSCSIM